jgi:uncharacterized protein
MTIDRIQAKARLEIALRRNSAVALVGPRQCGKTTLAREFVSTESINYFDLEDPLSLARLAEPMTALTDLKGLIVIDEIQRKPELFPILRVLIDRDKKPGRFLILGSASIHLLKQSSESLAGRLEVLELEGFSLSDIGVNNLQKHWLRGGFPKSFLSRSDEDSFAWRKNFIRTFAERDIPQFGIKVPSATILRFWTMLSHYHGQIWNAAELARSLSVGESSSRRYLDLLEDLFMVRQLQPWHVNLAKRQVKAPKIYLRDSGILHELLGVRTAKALLEHPKSGASWEGYALEEILKTLEVDEHYFWATHSGAELDLLLVKNNRKFGVEFKRLDQPKITPSMKAAIQDLDLEKITIIYPGDKQFNLSRQVAVMPLKYCASASVTEIIT